MKILCVSGTFQDAIGGAELTMRELVTAFSKKLKWEVLVVTRKPESGPRGSDDFLQIVEAEHDERYRAISNAVKLFKPDVIFTQLMWSDVALEISDELEIPLIYRVCVTPIGVNFKKNRPSQIITSSPQVSSYIRKEYGLESTPIYPFIEKSRILFKSEEYVGKYVTLINPIPKKGALLFERIVKALPFVNFAVVPVWQHLKYQNGDFNRSLIKAMTESLGKRGAEPPTEVDFRDYNNVTYLQPNLQASDLYKNVSVLCVPSIWEEPFGRVAIEAGLNGIPVISSGNGALRDTVSRFGHIADVEKLDDWTTKIQSLRKVSKLSMSKTVRLCKEVYDDEAIFKDYVRIFDKYCS